MTRLKFKHPNKRFTHVLALKKKIQNNSNFKSLAHSQCSRAHVFSLYLSFFFLVIVFSTFFIFWATVFSTFRFHTNKDALSCHAVWRNFLSCFHFKKNKWLKTHSLCHIVWPKNKRNELTKERNFVSHRSLASFFFSLVKRYPHGFLPWLLLSAKLKAPVTWYYGNISNLTMTVGEKPPFFFKIKSCKGDLINLIYYHDIK